MKQKTPSYGRIMIITGILLVCGILVAIGSGCGGWGGCGWGGWGGCGECNDCSCGPKFYINGEENSGGQGLINNGPPVEKPELPSFNALPMPSISAYVPASAPGQAPDAPFFKLPVKLPNQTQYGKPVPPPSLP